MKYNFINKEQRFITTVRQIFLLFAILVAIFSSGDVSSAQSSTSMSPVQVYNTHCSSNESDWTLVTGTPDSLNPQETVLQNGLVRITYPCSHGIPEHTYDQSEGEKAGFVLWVNINGTYTNENSKNGDNTFGDWTYVGGSILTDPTAFKVIENTVKRVEIQIEFANHRMQAEEMDIPNPFTKNIILLSGEYGYVAKIKELGARPEINKGEHEVGFGGAQRHLFTYSTSFGYLWSLSDPVWNYQFLRDQNNGTDNLWGAGISFDNSYYRIVALKPEGPPAPTIRAYQFPGGCTAGIIRYNNYSAPWGDYEAYIGMVPYDGTNAKKITVKGNTATVIVPKQGHYILYTKNAGSLKGASYRYDIAFPDLILDAGSNTIDISGKTLVEPIIAPLTNGVDFPKDIFLKYIGVEK